VKRAPGFVAVTLDSAPAERTLADYTGSPVLLNVWATWCDPCREEMPSLERLHRDTRSRGLRVVAISIDDPGQRDLIREFVQENGLTFDVLHDEQGTIMQQYLVRGVPQTFLISSGGDIVGTRFVADWSSRESRALVDSLLLAGARSR
jgi:peroxiredoxin